MTTLNFEGKTYRWDERQFYLNMIQGGALVEMKPAPKPDEPINQPDVPATEPIQQPDPIVVTPEPTRLVANTIEPVTLQVGAPVEFRIPDSAFSGPVESIDVSDLPAGLSYNGAGRIIYGRPAKAGQRSLTVTAVSGSGITRQLVQTALMLIIETPGVTPAPVRPDPVQPELTAPVNSSDPSMIAEIGTATYQGKTITYIVEDNG